MEFLKDTEKDDYEEYEKIFSRRVKFTPKAKTVMSLEVREVEKSAIEILLTLWDGTQTTASVPGCESGGNMPFILYYVKNFVAPAVVGQDPLKQIDIDDILAQLLDETDQLLDETSNEHSRDELKKLARNVNWAASAAICKAGACSKEIPLYKYIGELAHDYDPELLPGYSIPAPAFNITNGVLRLEENLTKQHQHLVIVPSWDSSFRQSIEMIRKIYDVENYDQNAIDKGVEGCYTPSIQDIKKCLESLTTTIANLGYTGKVSFGVNIGASKFYEHDKTYHLNFKEERSTGDALIDVYESLVTEFNLVLIEDPFHMDDWEHYSELTCEIGLDAQIVMENDNIFDRKIFRSLARDQVCNALLLKVGQIESVTKCIETVSRCKSADWGILMSSHFSCQTSDPFLADLCVGLMLDKIKIGVSCITSSCKICNRIHEIQVEETEEFCRFAPAILDHTCDFLKSLPEDKVTEGNKQLRCEIKDGTLTKEEFRNRSLEYHRDL